MSKIFKKPTFRALLSIDNIVNITLLHYCGLQLLYTLPLD